MVQWELKNKKTGKLYWLSDREVNEKTGEVFNPMERLKAAGMLGRYYVTEIKTLTLTKSPIDFEIKKSIKHKESDKRGK